MLALILFVAFVCALTIAIRTLLARDRRPPIPHDRMSMAARAIRHDLRSDDVRYALSSARGCSTVRQPRSSHHKSEPMLCKFTFVLAMFNLCLLFWMAWRFRVMGRR